MTTLGTNPAAPARAQHVLLTRYPVGEPDLDCFEVVEADVPTPGADELLVRVGDLSLDPFLRTAITGNHIGSTGTKLGSVMPGKSVAQVVTSQSPEHPAGSWVFVETGWREWAVVSAASATQVEVPSGVSRSAVLGPLGMPGLTAYAAILRHLRPTVGDTVVISSATGGVGSVAGQLAKLSGARTIAIVGDDQKAALARDTFGYDEAVIRTSSSWREDLAAAAPDGVDAYLHMGDADVLDGVIRKLAVGARVSLCGLMDQYNDGPPTTMPVGPVIGARATLHGMVVYDHTDLIPEQLRRISALLVSGALRVHEDRFEGLAQAPEAFVRMMSGRNRGKVVVEVSA